MFLGSIDKCKKGRPLSDNVNTKDKTFEPNPGMIWKEIPEVVADLTVPVFTAPRRELTPNVG